MAERNDNRAARTRGGPGRCGCVCADCRLARNPNAGQALLAGYFEGG